MMMNSTVFSNSSAHSEAYLTHVLLRRRQGGLLPSPSRPSNTIGSPAGGQVWPSLQNALTLEITRAATSSTQASKACENEKKEECLSHSDLDDDTFFRQYANHKLREKANKNEPFPLKLYRILYEAKKNKDDDIISFCPGGHSFMIHSVEKFVKEIMPKYFTSTRMASFQRQLNLYGFRRRLRGNDKGGFFHDSFVQDQRNLCLTIKRKVQNLKVPPHLLTARRSSPVPSVATPRPAATPESGMSVSQRIMLASPSFQVRPSSQRLVTPDVNPRMEDTPLLEASPAVHSSVLMQQTALPVLPTLVGRRDIDSRLSVTSQLTASTTASTARLLKLNQQLLLAKERAAMKQQLAMAAINRLANSMDVP